MREIRGTKGAEYRAPKARESKRIEPKALSGVRSGEGCPLPSQLGGLGSVVSSPSGVRAANAFCHILGSRKHLLDSKMHFKKYICVLFIA